MHLVATLLTQIEDAVGIERRLGISVLIETALGMVNCDEIAAACPERMEAMVFGVADYAASLQSHTTSIGGANPDYAVLTDAEDGGERERHWGDQWHYALSQIAVVCRAHGLRPIDGPFGDFTDPEGYLASARRAAVLGYEGKWAIHPSQIELANEVFTPDDAHRREDPPDHRGDEGGRRPGQGRRVARRPADRRRLDPDGAEPAGQARADRGPGRTKPTWPRPHCGQPAAGARRPPASSATRRAASRRAMPRTGPTSSPTG